MRNFKICAGFIAVLAIPLLIAIAGCGYKGDADPNLKPVVNLYNHPNDGDTLGAAPIICWEGFDTDGKVYEFEYTDLPRAQAGSDGGGVPEETYTQFKGDPSLLGDVTFVLTEGGDSINWVRTENTCDTVFLALLVADSTTEHFFCVRAIDQMDTVSDLVCATYYRTNIPPDSCTITTDPFDGEEFWCLDSLTYSWDGINVAWRGSDPDNSIILEYYWRLENSTTRDVVLTSHFEDARGGMSSGLDSTDGWIRSTTARIYGPVPSENYNFIVQVRDDAFYVGAADTATIDIAHPEYDISREEVRQQYADGTYPYHRILLIDQNNPPLYPPSPDYGLEDVRSYYDSVLQQLVDEGVISGCSLVISASSVLNVSRQILGRYNILYVLDQEYWTGNKLGEDFLEELMLYVKVGGRIIADGRNIFHNEIEIDDELPSYDYFGIEEDADFTGSGNPIFQTAITNRDESEYPTLEIDPAKADTNAIRTVNRLGARPPFYGGSPYVEILYRFGLSAEADTTLEADDYRLGPVALRFVTPSFRTAYFAFPLFLMKNDAGQTDRVIRSTVEFIKQQVIPPPEEER